MLKRKIFFFVLFFLLFFFQKSFAQNVMRETLKKILCEVILVVTLRLYNLMIRMAPFLIVFFSMLWLLIHTVPPNDITSQIKQGAKQIGIAFFWIYFGFLILFFVFSSFGLMSWVGTFGKDMFQITCD